jgi:hypothetical protein
MSEVGTLEMHCVSSEDPARRWLLEFQMRGDGGVEAAAAAVLPARFADAVQAIERIFGASSQPVDSKEVRRLRGQLEHLLGKRDDWEMPLLRALFDALLQRARRRRRSPEHERLWLQPRRLLPAPGARRRARRLAHRAAVRAAAAGHPVCQREPELVGMVDALAPGCRRPAAAAQEKLLAELAPGTAQRADEGPCRRAAAIAGSHDDMLRLVARSKETAGRAQDRGRRLAARAAAPASKSRSAGGPWAASARARRSTAAPTRWCRPRLPAAGSKRVLATDWKKVEPAAFAATQIARLTGDRARDLPETARNGARAPRGDQRQRHLERAGDERRRTRQGRRTACLRRVAAGRPAADPRKQGIVNSPLCPPL